MGKMVESGFGYIEGRQIKKAKNLEAEQLERASIARTAAGTRDAYEQRKLGEKVASDAVAAMAAGGGVVDSDIVANINATTDYNVLSTLFAAKEESKQLDLTSRLRRHEGKTAQRMAGAKFLTTAISEGFSTFAGGGGAAGGGG